MAAKTYSPLPKTKEEWLDQADNLIGRADMLDALSRANVNTRLQNCLRRGAHAARELAETYIALADTCNKPKQKAMPTP